jgi:hypothetical protein
MSERSKWYYVAILLFVCVVSALIALNSVGIHVLPEPVSYVNKVEPPKIYPQPVLVTQTPRPTITPTIKRTSEPIIEQVLVVDSLIENSLLENSSVINSFVVNSSEVVNISYQPQIPEHTLEVLPTVTPISETVIGESFNSTVNVTDSNVTVRDWTYPYFVSNETELNITKVSSDATEFYHWVPYTYDGDRNVIMLTLNSTVYKKFEEKDSHCSSTLEACYHKYTDDASQKEYLAPLVRDIKYKSDNKDIQALHAIRFVQGLPYNNTKYKVDPTEWNYPYETLYNDGGVCSDKSELLVYLLRELGFATVIFHFELENHAAVGIKTNHTLGYAGTEYSFIETTTPAMIGYSNMSYNNGTGVNKLRTTPDVIQMSSGSSMGWYVNEEIEDAREMNRLDGLGNTLSKEDYDTWKEITYKYGM